MSKPQNTQHMSTINLKSDNLPSLQKLIIIHLSKNSPQTINETVNALSKSYKPVWMAFNSLQKKKLIRKTQIKTYRNRDFSKYWLTDEGMILAMLEGANPEFLLQESKVLFPELKFVHCFLESVPKLEPFVLRVARSVVKDKGSLDFADVATIFMSQSTTQVSLESMKAFASTLKKYPNEYSQLKTIIQVVIAQLNQMISD
ncbi:MAG: hypothetical protein GX638_09625 [Crenarchaeota archaeon]|nr:hypothetical protein [Thermoproteota archaeon]